MNSKIQVVDVVLPGSICRSGVSRSLDIHDILKVWAPFWRAELISVAGVSSDSRWHCAFCSGNCWMCWSCSWAQMPHWIGKVFKNVELIIAAKYGRPLYFAAVVSFFLLLFSSPILSSRRFISRRFDVCHTSTHHMALVRIYNACLKCAAHAENTGQKIRQKIAIFAPSHNFVGPYFRN